MENLLKNNKLSDEAIKIYLNCLGLHPLTFNELNSLIPDLNYEDIAKIIDELVNNKILVQIEPQKPEILTHYIAIPPYSYILNSYSNINLKLGPFQEELINSIIKIYKENSQFNLDSLNNQFQDIRKEFLEKNLAQKQKIENIEVKLDELKQVNDIYPNLKDELLKLKEFLSELQKKIKVVTQVQFLNLIKIVGSIETQLRVKVNELDLKKTNELVIIAIKEVFSSESQKMIAGFTETIYTLIALEFENIKEPIGKFIDEFVNKKVLEPINSKIENNNEYQNQLKSLIKDTMENMEGNFNKIQEIIVSDKENFVKDLQVLEKSISDNLNSNVQKLINQVTEIISPMEKSIQEFFNKAISIDKMNIDNVWTIMNNAKITEEIFKIFLSSKEEIVLIIPKIEDYIKKEQLDTLPDSIKVKIAFSEPPPDDLIKDFVKLSNFEFRKLRNDNMIALLGDNDHFLIGLIQNEQTEVLNNCIGIGSNFKHLINILAPVIGTSWDMAKTAVVDIKKEKPKPVSPTEVDFVSKFHPKENDVIGLKIDDELKNLIQKMDSLEGHEFSKELQKVSDLILEKVGFCTTLHNVSNWVSIYKTKYKPLDENDKAQIFIAMENWKEKLY